MQLAPNQTRTDNKDKALCNTKENVCTFTSYTHNPARIRLDMPLRLELVNVKAQELAI